jgi:hypothetical protein
MILYFSYSALVHRMKILRLESSIGTGNTLINGKAPSSPDCGEADGVIQWIQEHI